MIYVYRYILRLNFAWLHAFRSQMSSGKRDFFNFTPVRHNSPRPPTSPFVVAPLWDRRTRRFQSVRIFVFIRPQKKTLMTVNVCKNKNQFTSWMDVLQRRRIVYSASLVCTYRPMRGPVADWESATFNGSGLRKHSQTRENAFTGYPYICPWSVFWGRLNRSEHRTDLWFLKISKSLNVFYPYFHPFLISIQFKKNRI